MLSHYVQLLYYPRLLNPHPERCRNRTAGTSLVCQKDLCLMHSQASGIKCAGILLPGFNSQQMSQGYANSEDASRSKRVGSLGRQPSQSYWWHQYKQGTSKSNIQSQQPAEKTRVYRWRHTEYHDKHVQVLHGMARKPTGGQVQTALNHLFLAPGLGEPAAYMLLLRLWQGKPPKTQAGMLASIWV